MVALDIPDNGKRKVLAFSFFRGREREVLFGGKRRARD
jgi:hypothetical protein